MRTDLFLLLACFPLFGQVRSVPAANLGERIVAIVPMIGTGAQNDPFRPKYMTFLPPPGTLPPEAATLRGLSDKERWEASKLQFTGVSYILSDDKKKAIVEYVAKDKAAFEILLKDSALQAFDRRELEKDEKKKALALIEFRKVAKDFDLSRLRTPGF